VKRDPFHNVPALETLAPLIRSGLISVVQLSPSAFESTFLDLVGAASPNDLGDGEAATLAQAFETGAIPVIDERKAARVALALTPQLHIINTIDILSCTELVDAFPCGPLAELITHALFHARMRVPAFYRPWVCDIIGMDRAQQFPSLGPVK
jgi:hypothetical protein